MVALNPENPEGIGPGCRPSVKTGQNASASMRLFNRDAHRDSGAVSRLRIQEQGSIYQPGSLVHVQDAQSTRKPYLGQIETRTGIADRKLHGAVLNLQVDMNRGSWCVFKGVSECLLGDAV